MSEPPPSKPESVSKDSEAKGVRAGDLAFLEENKKVFVGLDREDAWGGEKWAITDQELHDVFSKIGEVKNAHVVKDKATGIAKGFAFVQFKDAASVGKAIAVRNQSELGGKKIIVRAVEERFDQRRADGKGGAADERPKKKRKRYHKNQEHQAEKVEEIDIVAGYATVTRAQKDAGVVTAPIFVKQIGGTEGVGSTFTCAAADVTGFTAQALLAQKRTLVVFDTNGKEGDGEQKAVNLRLPTAEEQKKIDLLIKFNPLLKSHNSKARQKKKTEQKQDKAAARKAARAKAREEKAAAGSTQSAGSVTTQSAGSATKLPFAPVEMNRAARRAAAAARKASGAEVKQPEKVASPAGDSGLLKQEKKDTKAAEKEAKRAEKEAKKAEKEAKKEAEKAEKKAKKAEKKAKKEGKSAEDVDMLDATGEGCVDDVQKQLQAELKKQEKLKASLQSLLGV
jgi:RNA recognition motif-containing protein